MDPFGGIIIFVGTFLVLNLVLGAIQRATERRRAVSATQGPSAKQVMGELGSILGRIRDYLGVLPTVTDTRKHELLVSGLTSKGQAKLGEALRSFYQFLALPHTPAERGAVSLLIANCLYSESSVAEAESYYTDALASATEAGDDRLKATILGNLALLHWAQGDTQRAREHLDEALRLDRALGNRGGEVVHVANLSRLLQATGDGERAQTYANQASEAYMSSSLLVYQANALANLAMAYRGQNRLDEARAQLERALSLHRECDLAEEEAVDLANLALIYSDKGDRQRARALLEEAQLRFRALGATSQVEKVGARLQMLA